MNPTKSPRTLPARLALLALGLLATLVPVACSPTRPTIEQGPRILLDGESADGAVRLFWNTHFVPYPYGFGPPIEPPKKVLLYISEKGPTTGFHLLAERPGGIIDSLFVPGLVNGRAYYFRATLLGGSHPLFPSSAPINLMPGVDPVPLLTLELDATGWQRSGITWSPDSREIAFVHQESEIPELRVVDLATRVERRLLADPAMATMDEPAWSPDGTQIAFTSSPSRTAGDIDYRIWLVDRAGTAPRSLSPGRVDFGPAWADGDSELVFCRGTHGPPNIAELYRVGLTSQGSIAAITHDQSLHKRFPDVRRSDGLVVFQGTTHHGSQAGLYLVPRTGGAIQPLVTSTWWNEFMPRWSPDGTRIAFTSNRSGHVDIWVLDLASRVARQMTTGRLQHVHDRQVTWSPDGSRIAVMEQGPWTRWRVNIFAAP